MKITKKDQCCLALSDKQVTIKNLLINACQKNNKKMQWSREGGEHNVLQIRASRFSKAWQQDWEIAQQSIYKKVA